MTAAPQTSTPPSPLEQAQTLLTRIRGFQRTFNNQAAQPGERLLGLCNAIGLMVFPKNQPILDNLGAEEVQTLRQEFMDLVLEQNSNLPSLYAQSVGREMPPEPVREADKATGESETETSGIKRWTRQSVLTWLNTPVELPTSKHPIYLQSYPYTDVIVQLLGTYGPMTIYQLCAMIMNQERVSSRVASYTIITRVKEAVRLLLAKQLVSARTVLSQNTVNLKLWRLETPGQIYFAILNDLPTPSVQESVSKTVQLQHSFGTNQVLASMAAAASQANKFGIIDNIVSIVLKENPKLNTPNRADLEIPAVNLAKSLEWVRLPKNRLPNEATFGCRVEFMRSGTPLEIGQTDRKAIIPDGMGKIIYDSDLPLPTLIQACNLTGDEENFPGSGTNNRHYWPFILEYDRATETSEYFAEKVEAYSRFYNTVQTRVGTRVDTVAELGAGKEGQSLVGLG